jgi:MFS family permease
VMALAADLTREEQRVKIMTAIGMTIGLSFAISMIIGPLLNSWVGVPGIFWINGLLAILSIFVLWFLVPTPVSKAHCDAEPILSHLRQVLFNKQLLRLNFGILTLHLLLTATFVAVPLALRDVGFPSHRHWIIYLISLIFSMVLMVPCIICAEKYRMLKTVFLGAVLTITLTEFGLFNLHYTVLQLAALMLIFFSAFNILEAILPSLVAKLAPTASKGTAMGIYSSSQFLGAFIGGTLGGWLRGLFGLEGVFAFTTLGALIWLTVACTMAEPRYLNSYLISVGNLDESEARLLATQLEEIHGVEEALILTTEGIAYLKIDQDIFDEIALKRLLKC